MYSKLSLFKTAVLMSLGCTSSVFAADIVPAKGVSLLVVNGVEVSSKMKPAVLEVGVNQILVRVDTQVGTGGSRELFTSAPYVISFKAGEDDIKIKSPKLYSALQAKSVFKNDPEWQLSSDAGQVAYQSEMLPRQEGLLPYSGLVEMVKEYNQQNGIYVGPAAVTVAAASEIALAPNKNQASPKKDKKQKPSQAAAHPQALEQMQAWYLKASKQERKEFRKWMIDQE